MDDTLGSNIAVAASRHLAVHTDSQAEHLVVVSSAGVVRDDLAIKYYIDQLWKERTRLYHYTEQKENDGNQLNQNGEF